jgi:hypothetical protein
MVNRKRTHMALRRHVGIIGRSAITGSVPDSVQSSTRNDARVTTELTAPVAKSRVRLAT